MQPPHSHGQQCAAACALLWVALTPCRMESACHFMSWTLCAGRLRSGLRVLLVSAELRAATRMQPPLWAGTWSSLKRHTWRFRVAAALSCSDFACSSSSCSSFLRGLPWWWFEERVQAANHTSPKGSAVLGCARDNGRCGTGRVLLCSCGTLRWPLGHTSHPTSAPSCGPPLTCCELPAPVVAPAVQGIPLNWPWLLCLSWVLLPSMLTGCMFWPCLPAFHALSAAGSTFQTEQALP